MPSSCRVEDALGDLMTFSTLYGLQQLSASQEAVADCLGRCLDIGQQVVAQGPPITVMVITAERPLPSPIGPDAVPTNVRLAVGILLVLTFLGLLTSWLVT